MYIILDSLLGWSLWITFRKINSAQVYKGIKCAWNFAYYSFSSILFPLNTIKYCKYFYTVNYESISKCVCWNTWVSHFLEREQTYFEHNIQTAAGRRSRYMCIIRSLNSLTQSTDNTFQTKAVMTSLFLKTNLIVIFWINHFSLLFLLTAFFFIELILLAAADFYNVSVLWIIKVVTIFLISSWRLRWHYRFLKPSRFLWKLRWCLNFTTTSWIDTHLA